MPAVVIMDLAQDREGTGQETFHIVVEEFAVNTHAPVFDICGGRLMLRVADVGGKCILPANEIRPGFHLRGPLCMRPP